MGLLSFLWPSKIKVKLQTEHEVELVFVSGDVEYYKFVNEFKIPYVRAMAAMDIYRAFEEKVDAKYQKIAYAAIIELLRKGDNIGAGRVAQNSLERMENITNVDLMYKLASVLYFDASENPYSYDTEYAEKKIKLWRKDNDIESFFLKTPLSDYLPSFNGLGTNITQYTVAQRKLLILDLKSLLLTLSAGNRTSELTLTLRSQIEELEESVMMDLLE